MTTPSNVVYAIFEALKLVRGSQGLELGRRNGEGAGSTVSRRPCLQAIGTTDVLHHHAKQSSSTLASATSEQSTRACTASHRTGWQPNGYECP